MVETQLQSQPLETVLGQLQEAGVPEKIAQGFRLETIVPSGVKDKARVSTALREALLEYGSIVAQLPDEQEVKKVCYMMGIFNTANNTGAQLRVGLLGILMDNKTQLLLQDAPYSQSVIRFHEYAAEHFDPQADGTRTIKRKYQQEWQAREEAPMKSETALTDEDEITVIDFAPLLYQHKRIERPDTLPGLLATWHTRLTRRAQTAA